MPTYRVQVANHGATALPKDYFVNTLYFQRDTDPTDAQWTTFLTALGTAWNALTALAYPSLTIKAYNMAQPTPRPIVAQYTHTGSDGTPGPTEVALCLSYYSGRNLPRTRGRIYIGPFNGIQLSTVRPDGALINNLLTLGSAIDTAAATFGAVWMIHSVKDADYLPITNLWVDNAWDTQRRRGVSSTARVTRTL